MIKILLFLSILLQQNQSASSWEKIKLGNYMEFDFPANYERIDTLGQTVFMMDGNNSFMTLSILTKDAIPDARMTGIEDLSKFYNGIESGVTSATGGQVIESKDTLSDNLKSRYFVVDAGNGEEKKYLSVVVQDKVMQAMVWYLSEDREQIDEESQKFLNSFKFNISPTQQVLPARDEDTLAYKVGQLLGQFSLHILIPVVILLIYVGRQKKKNSQSVEKKGAK